MLNNEKRLNMQFDAEKHYESRLVIYTVIAVLSSMYVLLENVHGIL